MNDKDKIIKNIAIELENILKEKNKNYNIYYIEICDNETNKYKFGHCMYQCISEHRLKYIECLIAVFEENFIIWMPANCRTNNLVDIVNMGIYDDGNFIIDRENLSKNDLKKLDIYEFYDLTHLIK